MVVRRFLQGSAPWHGTLFLRLADNPDGRRAGGLDDIVPAVPAFGDESAPWCRDVSDFY